ncbi:unnamed protein product [Sphenostylis stenocarpa]|uniref:Uncharacterized protein n=1 Tax=Sphenostylis stenocarpa TaxID=92480 RepID=A0AA86RV44_9FABA|nr:unnamed protein product [Sphenostylis stenocarpa]
MEMCDMSAETEDCMHLHLQADVKQKIVITHMHHGFTHGYTPSTVGGYGPRADGRFSLVASGQSGFAPFGSGYGISMNFEPGLNAEFGGNANFNSNLSYGRGVNPYFIGSSNRFGSPVGFVSGNGGNNSLLM